MRALVIAQGPGVIARWRLALTRERIEPIEVGNALEAISQGTTVGFDLIVMAGDLGAVTPVDFMRLTRLGLFGVRPPPVIVEVTAFGDILGAGEGAFAGCIIVEPAENADLAAVIERAFLSRDGRMPDTGDHHA
jgi:DNA-binding LytR/AlgR family response regulator